MFHLLRKSTTGHSFFRLLSDEADDILGAIKHYICLALAVKQNARTSSASRHRSTSVTTSEKSFQRLLDSQTAAHPTPHSEPQPIPMPRSDSSSSNSTSNFDSSGRSTRLSNSPGSSLTTGHFSGDFASFLEMEETGEPDFCQPPTDLQISDPPTGEKVTTGCRRRSSSHPDNPYLGNHDYSEIKDIAGELKSVSRRNTISCEPAEVDFDRLRSVSAVVASLKASNNGGDMYRVLPSSSQNKGEDKSDFDSAISSMALSAANEELPLEDEQHCCEAVCADNQCSCLPVRRRSSSTPDLQTFWKTNRFENVYEELDELRASVQRLNKKRDSVVPPQLPARPISANSTHRIHPDIKDSAPMNKALLKMRGVLSLDESESRSDRPCLCADLTAATRHDGQCAVCRWQGASDRRKLSARERPPRHNQTDSLLSTINDINSIILQVQNVKRRRSSDITPVAASLASTISSDINYAKVTSQQSQREDVARSVRSVSTAPGDLIDLQDATDNLDLQKPVYESLRSQAQSNISDSLIHFFLDDEGFSSEPAVTSEDSAQPTDNLWRVTKTSHSARTTQPSGEPSLSPAHKTSTWPGHSSRHETSTGLAGPLGHDILVDIWGQDTRHLSGSADAMDAAFQDFFASSFSREPLI